MGSKGSNTVQSNQNQTYQPNPAATGYINNAIQAGEFAAGAPFQQPVAPVAGFSGAQQNAFNTVNNAQGMALPYINSAANLFGQSAQGPNISQFFNPFASAVSANLQDIFGQQNAMNTGSLTQAAGGVGADRIAVGQSELAKQQGLTAGQTFANLFQPSLSAAEQEQNILQGAGYGLGVLGPAAQNSVFQGAQAQLGTGGLQQQLAQAQLNAPYQNTLARLAYPFQTAQFNAGITGALAPGLGGTTTGYGGTTYPSPSPWSQALGAGAVGAGILGQTGAFGQNGYLSNLWNSGGNQGVTPNNPYDYIAPQGQAGFSQTAQQAQGGRVNPYAYDDGGGVPVQSDPYLRMMELQMLRGDAGGGAPVGGALPSGLNGAPINAGPQSVVPSEPLTPIQPHIPQLPQAPSQQQQNSGGLFGSLGSIAGSIFAPGVGTAAGSAAGGLLDKATGIARGGAVNPYDEMAAGGVPDPAGVDNPDSPYNQQVLAGTADVDARLNAGTGGLGLGAPYEGSNPALMADANISRSAPRPGAGMGGPGAPTPNPYMPSPPIAPQQHDNSFINSPWAALTAAGLGIMGGTSPFPGVNIGQGGMRGLQMLQQQQAAGRQQETVEQASRRLDLEAQKNQFEMSKPYPSGQVMDPNTGYPLTTYSRFDPTKGWVTTNPFQQQGEPNAPAGPSGAQVASLKPGVDIPQGVNPDVLTNNPDARLIQAIDEGRENLQSVPMRKRAKIEHDLNNYDPGYDQTTWNARNKQQSDLASNGTDGKMINAVNQLLPHLRTASDDAAALDNSSYPAANTIANWWATATGDPRVKKFQSVREVAAMDAARLLRGSGQMAEKDIDEWRRLIHESGSPAQMQGVIGQLADDLIGARISSIQHGYRMVMRKEPPEFVSPDAKEALAAIKKRVAATGSPTGGAAAAGAKQRYVTQNGHTYELQPDGNYK